MHLQDLVALKNSEKILFTPGPASLLPENMAEIGPCFGRGDSDYENVEGVVLSHLLKLSGHKNIARMQGSATLALEIMVRNFLSGRVIVVSSGYYSERLEYLARSTMSECQNIREVDYVSLSEIDGLTEQADWVVACLTETSRATLLPINKLRDLADRTGSQLMLDATASIGLETGHEKADVIGYSSCKGLLGLTGGAFVAFNEPPRNKVQSFNLSLESHMQRKTTGPYHAIQSLSVILPRHSEYLEKIRRSRDLFCSWQFEDLTGPMSAQPLLCTHTLKRLSSKDPRVILYKPRQQIRGSIICHIGEVHKQLEHVGENFGLLEPDEQ